MAGLHGAPGMRCEGNQSNQSNRRPPQPQRGRGKSRGTILSRQQGGTGVGGGREGSCDCKLSKNKLVQKTKRNRENDFGRASLKLCWVMIGWLPPLPFPVTDTDSRYASFTYMTIFTLYRCSVRFSSWTKTKRKTCHRLERCVSFIANGRTAGRGSDVTSALTVLLSSWEMFLKFVSCIKWRWNLQVQLCPVTGYASLNVWISQPNKKNVASSPSLAWI